ncbi:MAG: 50S ribosomal protein L3 [Dehalococcoidia bacterium]|nr:50S ribosomal protein L3 [Dehalococcoidia bacterium]
MVIGLLGKKIGMTQVFRDNGAVEAVTAIEAGPCVVTQVKARKTDGYDAVQLGFGEAKRLNQPEQGHLKKLGKFKYLREMRVADVSKVELGQKVDVSQFQAGDTVDVVGTSKGKGFQGGVKRYHFRGGPKTHGASDRTRAPGSVGPTHPGRVVKGLRMAGHMGDERVTVRNLIVVKADPEKNLLLLKGAVPGGPHGLLTIKKSRS